MMIYLRISLFFCLFLVSCSLTTTKNAKELPLNQKVFENPYFADVNKDYVYKAKIDVYGNYFGGIMVFKKLGNEHHRMVFTTEFGAKIFDFEFKNQKFIKNYVVKKLDKKIIINTLRKDFQLLLQEKHDINAKFVRGQKYLYRSNYNKKWKFCVENATTQQLEKIIYAHKFKEKIIISFQNITDNVAREIALQHKNIRLHIDLKMIN